MTQPGPQGFPDWQRASKLADILYLNESLDPVTGTILRGPFYVGTQASLGIYAETITGGFRVRFKFYDTQAKTTLLDRHEFWLPNHNPSLHQSISTLGPWLEVEAFTAAPLGSLNLAVWGTYGKTSVARSASGSIIIEEIANAIAAGATEDIYSTAVWPGEAFLCFQQASGTCKLTLSAERYDGVAFPFWSRTLTAAQPVGEKIALPTAGIKATIQNTSGAPTSYDLYLTGVHTLAG